MTVEHSAVHPADFDMHSDAYNADPDGYLRRYREGCPIGRSAKHGGYWYATRYADLGEVARNAKVFSSASGLMIGSADGSVKIGKVDRILPEGIDPPQLAAYRRLFLTNLSPRAVAAMSASIARWTTYSIDQIIEGGHCDLVADVINPIPGRITMEWLGLPVDDWELYAMPVHDYTGYNPGTAKHETAISRIEHFQDLVAEAVVSRREDPRDDFISFLAGQQIDGRPITNDEVESMVYLSIVGGVDTTTSLTSSALVCLDRRPDLRTRLIREPNLLDESATEEFLRFFSPVKSNARTVTEDVVIAGCLMHAGDKIGIPWPSANRDPDQFADPDEIYLDRFPNRHMAFGMGPHRCLGSHLARAMFREMMTQILRRMPDYRVIRSGLEAYPSAWAIGGWLSVPITFTPGVREG
jgi:cytochrome P450